MDARGDASRYDEKGDDYNDNRKGDYDYDDFDDDGDDDDRGGLCYDFSSVGSPPPYDFADNKSTCHTKINSNNSGSGSGSKMNSDINSNSRVRTNSSGNTPPPSLNPLNPINPNPNPLGRGKLEEIEIRAKERKHRMMELKDRSKSLIQKRSAEDAEAHRVKELEGHAALLKAQNEKRIELDKIKRQSAKYLMQFQQQSQQRIDSANAQASVNGQNEQLEKYNKAKRYYERMLGRF